MVVTPEQLRFDRVVREQMALHGWGRSDLAPDYVLKSARMMHALNIQDGLSDALSRSIALSNSVRAREAGYHLRFGAARRLQMMWKSWRSVFGIAREGRTEPLTLEESGELTQAVNLLYLNLRGVLDNLSWVLLHEHVSEKLPQLKATQVGLFLPCITQDPRFAPLASALQEHDEWQRDVKSRRDPAAHRIPLYVPPQIVSAEQAETHAQLMGQFWDATARLDFGAADAARRQADALGVFAAYLSHDPDEAPVLLFPTLPDDLGHVIEIFGTVEKFLVATSARGSEEPTGQNKGPGDGGSAGRESGKLV